MILSISSRSSKSLELASPPPPSSSSSSSSPSSSTLLLQLYASVLHLLEG
ncbi:hypothetical protein LguiA_026945 [Lonicera macranthoides]